MKNVKYTVNINNIYVGTVIKADMENLFRINNGVKLPKNLSGELGIESEKKLRNIYFHDIIILYILPPALQRRNWGLKLAN